MDVFDDLGVLGMGPLRQTRLLLPYLIMVNLCNQAYGYVLRIAIVATYRFCIKWNGLLITLDTFSVIH